MALANGNLANGWPSMKASANGGESVMAKAFT